MKERIKVSVRENMRVSKLLVSFFAIYLTTQPVSD